MTFLWTLVRGKRGQRPPRSLPTVTRGRWAVRHRRSAASSSAHRATPTAAVAAHGPKRSWTFCANRVWALVKAELAANANLSFSFTFFICIYNNA